MVETSLYFKNIFEGKNQWAALLQTSWVVKTVLLSPTGFVWLMHTSSTKNICTILIYISEGEFQEISWVCHLCYKEHCKDRQLLIINWSYWLYTLFFLSQSIVICCQIEVPALDFVRWGCERILEKGRWHWKYVLRKDSKCVLTKVFTISAN